MLATATDTHAEQERITQKGLRAAERSWRLGRPQLLTPTLALLMSSAAKHGAESVEVMLAEQGLDAPAEATVVASTFARTASDGRSLSGLVEQARSLPDLMAMVVTQIADSGRVAASVATAARPRLSGYVRNVGPKCCGRCAILSGRFYRWNEGFLRHPRCHCTHVPTTRAGADTAIRSPEQLFREGRITDLSKADVKAINDGADLGQVVNVQRKAAGLSEAGRVLVRDGRLMPEGIYRIASDRNQALELLQRNGFIR